jgi:hypothetical protein
MTRTCTAAYAIERGVTVVRPMSDATLDQVAVNVFLARFTTDWSSASSVISSAAEDGEVKMDLKACGRVKKCPFIREIGGTLIRRMLFHSPFSISFVSQTKLA